MLEKGFVWHLMVMEGEGELLMNQFVKYYQNCLISLVDLGMKGSICDPKELIEAHCKRMDKTGSFLRNWRLAVSRALSRVRFALLVQSGLELQACLCHHALGSGLS